MRILGMTELWPKLAQDTFTTFRFARKDRDWTVGETVQIVYKPRSPKATVRGILGQAEIVKINARWVVDPRFEHLLLSRINENPGWGEIPFVTEEEAIADGFESRRRMILWLANSQEMFGRNMLEPMNKIRLRWRQVWLYIPESQAPDTMRKWAEMQGRLNLVGKPTVDLRSGYITPTVYESELLKECGIEPPVITISNSFLRG